MMSNYMTWLIGCGYYSKTAYRNADVLSQLTNRITIIEALCKAIRDTDIAVMI